MTLVADAQPMSFMCESSSGASTRRDAEALTRVLWHLLLSFETEETA